MSYMHACKYLSIASSALLLIQPMILAVRPRRNSSNQLIYRPLGLALSMHLLILFIKSFVVNTFCVAIVGLAYASIFPGNMGQANEVFPDDIRMIGMALMYARTLIYL